MKLFQSLFLAETIVSPSFFYQLLCIFGINLKPFGLPIWAVTTASSWAFVFAETKPIQCFKNLFFCSLDQSLSISIFNSNYKIAAIFPSPCEIEESLINCANMREACGRGCDSSSYHSCIVAKNIPILKIWSH